MNTTINILFLLGGAGVGSLVVGVVFIYVLGTLGKGTKAEREKQSKYNAETVQLMRERNEIDREKVKHLEQIAEWAASHRRL